MTQSRNLFSANLSTLKWVLPYPCLQIATQRLQVCSATSALILTVAPFNMRDSNCAVSGIRAIGVVDKTPFNTQ